MRFEILLFAIALFWMANIYTDGKYLKYALSLKKYYQMAAIGLGALFLYWIFRKNPMNAHRLISSSNEYLKYLPVDRNVTGMLSPILDFTSKYGGGTNGFAPSSIGSLLGGTVAYDQARPILHMPSHSRDRSAYSEDRVANSGAIHDGKKTKRSVSETKKKYVASRQNWRCGHCDKQLPAWFEVDHKVRLEYGGSNHIDNLVALCRDCHGEKTAMENL